MACIVAALAIVAVNGRTYQWQRMTTPMIDGLSTVINNYLDEDIDLRENCDILELSNSAQKLFGRLLAKGYRYSKKAASYDEDDR